MISVRRKKKIKIILCLFLDRVNRDSPLPWLNKISCCGTKPIMCFKVVLSFQVMGRTFSNILKNNPKINIHVFPRTISLLLIGLKFVWILRIISHYYNKSRQFCLTSYKFRLSVSIYLHAHHACFNTLVYFQYSKPFLY